MNKWEMFLLSQTGKIIMAIAGAGIVFTSIFDWITRGLYPNFGWLQVTGIVVFAVIYILGMAINEMLKKAKDMIEEWLKA
jgi:hypothetical protein